MHLLKAQIGGIEDGREAVDLGQSPGDVVVLSSADTEIAGLARARHALGPEAPELRLANLLQLTNNFSVDLYVEQTLRHAKLIVVRVLGGPGYWQYGLDELLRLARGDGVRTAVISGAAFADPTLDFFSTVAKPHTDRLWTYLVEGGPDNLREFLRHCRYLIGAAAEPGAVPTPLPKAGVYRPAGYRDSVARAYPQPHPFPSRGEGDLPSPRSRQDFAVHPGNADVDGAQMGGLERRGVGGACEADGAGKTATVRPTIAITFYRALLQAGDLAPIDQLAADLDVLGFDALPIYLASPKDAVAADLTEQLIAEARPDAVINLTAFSVSTFGDSWQGTLFDRTDVPVIQAVLAGDSCETWAGSQRGLSARDVAMHVALPEIDGRIISRAISFKGLATFDDGTQTNLVVHQPLPDRTRFVAALAAGWSKLRRTPAANRRVAVVLANYPSNDAEIGNGVGLDTPASAVALLEALTAAGYRLDGLPASGDELVRQLQAGPTNKAASERAIRAELPLATYCQWFGELPEAFRQSVVARWGEPTELVTARAGSDPKGRPPNAAAAEQRTDAFFLPARAAFSLPLLSFGNIVVAVQPGRGLGLDAKSSHHDQQIAPPHGTVAFYLWLRRHFAADAVIHLGKHGNLEWMPGKAMALSEACAPEVLLGPLPNIYPFIVNDPGEGTQAKRRTAAVIVDHLTPPLTRAESYGPLRDLEALVDEYFEAAGIDPRRLKYLGRQILDLARATGLDKDCGVDASDRTDDALGKLDNFLCDLKEMQIRDGLHVFGRSPLPGKAAELLLALTRLPRGSGEGSSASLTRALAADFGLGEFDPLDCRLGDNWPGPRPAILTAASDDPWRTVGDTLERLELLAARLIGASPDASQGWLLEQASPRELDPRGQNPHLPRTAAVLRHIEEVLRPKLAACGPAEIAGVLTALDGRFVMPGPAGAPTRGRLDVLPTGRNFFSIDTRTVPTEAAYRLGSASAERLVKVYFQEHGRYPVQFAVSAWGTANMRTGGDDIAQALALAGVRPTWDQASRRVSGYQIVPLSELRRPRVDVLFRISGFFRDAFPTQIDLVDSAFRAIAGLDEPDDANPLAAETRRVAAQLQRTGLDDAAAVRRAASRVFGTRPGGYGAGVKDLVETGKWTDRGDLARAYLAASSFAYGSGVDGDERTDQFAGLVGRTDAVVQNQDTREFDILDSTDFFEFEGGLASAVAELAGREPAIYHNDHSRPERPEVRRLGEEIARVVRARAANPKWLTAARSHGYKGGSEMVATVKNLVGFAATTTAVGDHQFDLLYDAYLVDPENLAFLANSNPAAIDELARRFIEAIDRQLWRPKRNSAYEHLKGLAIGIEKGGVRPLS